MIYVWTGGRITYNFGNHCKEYRAGGRTMMMMQYKGSISNRTKKLRRCLQAALFAKCNEERQVKNTCKFRAAGDSIFLLTFNLLYMLFVCYKSSMLFQSCYECRKFILLMLCNLIKNQLQFLFWLNAITSIVNIKINKNRF